MKAKEKDTIIKLYNNGWTAGMIADALDIPTNTIKSFIYRNVKRDASEPLHDVSTCAWCGKNIETSSGKKTKRFCSDKCRTKYWNKKKRDMPYRLICVNCHKAFVSFGNKNKHFCSDECIRQYKALSKKGCEENGKNED